MRFITHRLNTGLPHWCPGPATVMGVGAAAQQCETKEQGGELSEGRARNTQQMRRAILLHFKSIFHHLSN